jgi:CRP-like cAMP-binding protein
MTCLSPFGDPGVSLRDRAGTYAGGGDSLLTWDSSIQPGHTAAARKVPRVPHKFDHLAKKLGTFMQLSEREVECLAGLQRSAIRVKAGGELVHEGQTGHLAYILQSGWACSFKLLPDGGRQIIAFPLPGDCVGLRSVLLRTSDHSFSALTDVIVSSVEASRMMEVFNEFPRLGAAILWAASRDEAMVVEHLVSIGRRTAIERTAHFFLELSERLRLVGLADDKEFACPLNQYVLADALGLSAIHVNRVLRQLRERKLLTLKDRKVTVLDMAKLKALAGFQEQ